ncbi:TraR/DksA family transcriptional regulator [Streptomyces sp. NRRL S-1813]|uniref:TraR/DksA family transcriptional regulator n=1 Tax=Streptomyces sp. NRRL S-1813 TaxID=1463888 RepID=UPI00068CE291|nr:TraR/DksA family transcriptional regulator [Streptomyces sp. NRRL S-1813]
MEDRTESAGGSRAQWTAAAERIAEDRAGTERLIGSLTRLWDGVVEAASLTANDDEHDPEGATVAFERAHLRDMLKQAHADLDDLDRAARRIATGAYGSCERCGGPISSGRLTARPTARTCIGCANKAGR